MKTKSPLVPELYVSNLRASLMFYVELIGFGIEFDRPEQRFAAADPDGYLVRPSQTLRLEFKP